MKRKNIVLVMLLALSCLFAVQSCKKAAPVEPTGFMAAMPAVPVPAADAVVPFTGAGQTITLSWEGTASSAISWNVYFGTSSNPALVATGVTTNSYTVTIQKGGVFYWGVATTDPNNESTASPVWSFDVNSNPNVPTTPVPALNAVNVSCNPTIAWAASDPQSDPLTYDLYLGKTATPTGVAATGLTDTSFVVAATLSPNSDYYWKVVAHDPYGGSSESPVWKFTTGALPITSLTGSYNADEPAEGYSYGVNFTFGTSSTVICDNYWNSGWVVTFTVDLTKLTYTFPVTTFQTGWTGTESGIVDLATGTMTGTYTIWHNGALFEQGVHTYTKL
jgi:hypothetical protein